MKAMKWAIVADDLTGAADAAVVFADRGVETAVWLNEPEEFPDGTCCSVDADARWQDEKGAAKAISKFVRKLRNADWLMLKIDSTLRGFVGAMVQGAWKFSKRKWALIAPSVPKQGRKVVNGKLFVRGQLVNEIDLAKEQPIPVTTPFVAERLRNTGLDKFPLEHLTLDSVRQSNCLTQAIERVAAKGVGLICDAETDMDLERIVSMAIKAPMQPLFVGASGLANALAKVTGKDSAKRRLSPKPHSKQILVLVGSQQTLARKQIEFLAAKGVPMSEISGESLPKLSNAEICAVLLKPNVLLDFASRFRKTISAGHRSQVPNPDFQQWLKSNPADTIIIVGGLTARAIFELLGVKRWNLLGSLLPGVPFGVVQFHDRTLLVATKAGGFGTKQTLWRTIVELKQSDRNS